MSLRIEACDVSVRYRGRVVVDSASFSADPGTFTVLLGANGAGKSTLLRAMTGIVRGTGVTTYGGRRWVDLAHPRRTVGALLNPGPVSPGMRLGAHLSQMSRAAGVAPSRVGSVLELFGLENFARARIEALSAGTRQRAGLAVAELAEPPVLLLDEPTSALDPAEFGRVHDWLGRVRDGGRTVVVATHDLLRFEEIADRAIVMKSGSLVANLPAVSLTEIYRERA